MTVTTLSSDETGARSRGLGNTMGGFSADPASARVSTAAISWGAIAAGAAAAASLSLILLMLGVGLGLSSVSPWAREGVSATALGVSTIIWLTVTQLLASGMGGYLAGRLRTRWTEVQADEVYFRDTAHGFLAWAVATLATAALLTSAVGSIVGGGVQAGAALAGGVAGTAATATTAATAVNGGAAATTRGAGGDTGPMGYFVDSLFRRAAAPASVAASPAGATSAASAAGPAAATVDTPSSTAFPDASQRVTASETAEVSRIFMNVSKAGPLPPEDLRYVALLVAQRTGLSQRDAEQRVDDVYTKAQTQLRDAEVALREAADKARKASATSALWLFVSLLVGAFVASLAATWGGRNRDA